jgi:predicted ATP-dependent protease
MEKGVKIRSKKRARPPAAPLESVSWSDPPVSALREMCRVSHDLVVLNLSPEVLPLEPAPTSGLFELLGATARRALTLGLTAREPNFHVFVAAEPEVFIEDDLLTFAEACMRGRETPNDIVYVHDFDRPEAPGPVLLPAGRGRVLVHAMDQLIEHLKEAIPSLGHAEPIKKAQADLSRKLEEKNRELISSLESTAKTLGFGIRSASNGLQTFPILHGKPLTAEQFSVLDESTKRTLSEAEQKLTVAVEKSTGLVKEASSKFELAREEAFGRAAEAVVSEAVAEVLALFADDGPGVLKYIHKVEAALVADWHDLVIPEKSGEDDEDSGSDADPEHATNLQRFKVNLVVSHEPGAPPPVVQEKNPTFPNLFGYLERRARFGALLTDFTRMRAGSMLRASGGVLLVRAQDLLTDPMIWDRLKRILRERQISPEDPLGPLGMYATTLRPVPVQIRTRIILVGSEESFSMLLSADPDFAALFRVKVEVAPSVKRTQESLVALDGLLMKMAKEREWGSFTRDARAKLLDMATRLSGERGRLSICLGPLEETAAFASALAAARGVGDVENERDYAGEEGAPSLRRPFRASIVPQEVNPITKEEVDLAWRERRERTGSAEKLFRELIVKGEVALDTQGMRAGVINGLSVLSTGDVEFGQPVRITAVVSLGREGLVDVEREAQLSGAIHTKGVAILRGYLGRMFGQERPLSLRAQLAFEQSYGEIDGDSASAAELFALLSALSDVGIDQSIAVTGSINQLGAIQAVGGVSSKVEGFFEVCSARGLTGKQGVMLPRTNLEQLVLRDDVAHAIEAGTFHIYAIDTVAQGIEVLTGLPAGERDQNGRFSAVSVFGRVERRIIEIAERLREAETQHPGIPAALDSMEDVSVVDLGGAEDNDFR